MSDAKALVEFALAKSGYTAKFVSAAFEKALSMDAVYTVTYYNDDGELETGHVYIDLATGKGEF
jgi:hypothetical protein